MTTAALAAVCSVVGLDPAGAVRLRLAGNAVYRLTTAPVVVRICLTPALRHRTGTVTAVGRWLAGHGVPAVRLLDGVEQPVHAGRYAATLWHEVRHDGPAATGTDLARLLRAWHALPDPPEPLPRWEPLGAVRGRLADADGVDPADQAILVRRCDEVQAALEDLEFELPPGPIHGDAHLGNLIPAHGGPVLCDFDSACVGPREWDLLPLAVGRLRFGHPPQHYRDLADGYGVDVTRWPGFDVLRQVRELKMVTLALPILRSHPEVRTEFAVRMQTFRDGRQTAPWAPFR
ncbi:MAG TPA: aminoglycoside phosphotransferase family protein [Pseudonocardiaceae bacterium]